MSTILEEASHLVDGDRVTAYGHPKTTFTRTAALWSAYLGVEIKPEDFPMLMILLKISRDKHRHKRDNLIDIAGYARTREKLEE